MTNNVNLQLSALVYQAESAFNLMNKYKNLSGEHDKSMYYSFFGKYNAICEIIRLCGYIPHIENNHIVVESVKRFRRC